MKETSKLKNCPNEPISSHEAQHEEKPPIIVTSCLYSNALWRVTSESKSMSNHQRCSWATTGKSDMARIVEWLAVIVLRNKRGEFRQVWSSLPFIAFTSHDQCRIDARKTDGSTAQSNGGQLRQVCSSVRAQTTHYQTQYGKHVERHHRQTEAISTSASLFIILPPFHLLLNSKEAW